MRRRLVSRRLNVDFATISLVATLYHIPAPSDSETRYLGNCSAKTLIAVYIS